MLSHRIFRDLKESEASAIAREVASAEGREFVLGIFGRFLTDYQKPGASLISEIANARLNLLKVWPEGKARVDELIYARFPGAIAERITGKTLVMTH